MYCTNCGKLLQDGEICDCQKQNTGVQMEQPQVTLSPIAEAVPIENAAPAVDQSFNDAVARSDATIANAAAAADATITGTTQNVSGTTDAAKSAEAQPVDPIKARIAQQQAEDAAATAAAAAAAAHARDMAAQNAGNRANQYYQQYAPQNQAPAGQPQNPNGQFGQFQNQAQPQNNPYGQFQNQAQPQNNQYGQFQNQAQPNNQFGQAPYGQPQYNQANQYQNNPYANSYNQAPPSYYNQQVYMTDEERLNKYMSSPKFVAARDFMCSMPVLLYAIAVSAMLVYFVVTMTSIWSLIHPLYILLCIAAWITFASGLKSKKNNVLPSTAGLSIGSGVAITMLVLWCIAFGLTIIMLLIAVVTVLQSGLSVANTGALVLFITFAISILALVLGIKYYSVQSRNLKNIRYCITNEANPRRFSIFPSVILFLGIVISIISLVGMQSILGSVKLKDALSDYLLDYFGNSGIESFSPGFAKTMTDQLINAIWSKEAQVLRYVSTALGIFDMAATAILYISAKSKLNDFTEL